MAAPSSRQVLRNLLFHASLGAYLLFDPWHDQLNAMVRKAHTCFRYYIMKYLFTNINWKKKYIPEPGLRSKWSATVLSPLLLQSWSNVWQGQYTAVQLIMTANSKCFIKCVIKMWIFSVWHSGALHFLNVLIKSPLPPTHTLFVCFCFTSDTCDLSHEIVTF